jgi:hypothetical protein
LFSDLPQLAKEHYGCSNLPTVLLLHPANGVLPQLANGVAALL